MKSITDRVYELANKGDTLAKSRHLSAEALLFASLLAVLDEEQTRREKWETEVEAELGKNRPIR